MRITFLSVFGFEITLDATVSINILIMFEKECERDLEVATQR